MRNDYQYLDSDYIYTNPQNGVLRNLLGIENKNDLSFAETVTTTKRATELEANPIIVVSADSLFDIHRYLFQDVYEWAGKQRTVEISKDGKQFFPISHFDNAIVYINSLITDYKRLDKGNKQKLADALALILDNVNFLHPFREGNGRAQREFLRLLALEKGWLLNLNPPDIADVYEKYMSGTINSDIETLARLIHMQMSE